jgi:hypothetical protein
MKERGLGEFDLTWKPDQRVALVSKGDRADQCYRRAGELSAHCWTQSDDGFDQLTMRGTEVMVNVLSCFPSPRNVCIVSFHQLGASALTVDLKRICSLELRDPCHAQLPDEPPNSNRHDPLAAVS